MEGWIRPPSAIDHPVRKPLVGWQDRGRKPEEDQGPDQNELTNRAVPRDLAVVEEHPAQERRVCGRAEFQLS
jgi:hypothetical protein